MKNIKKISGLVALFACVGSVMPMNKQVKPQEKTLVRVANQNKPFVSSIKKTPSQPTFQKKVSGAMIPYQGFDQHAWQGQKFGVAMKSRL